MISPGKTTDAPIVYMVLPCSAPANAPSAPMYG